MPQTNSSVIKPSASGTTILKEEGGGTALTIDAAGDVQITNSITVGKIGPNVVVPQATTKHIHRYTAKANWLFSNGLGAYTDMGDSNDSAAGNRILFGIFKPIDRANSFWIECAIPVQSVGNDHSCAGLLFARHGGGSDVSLVGKGYAYTDTNNPTTSMTTNSQYVGVAGNTFGAGDSYNIYWRVQTVSSQPKRFTPTSSIDHRIHTATEAHLVIYEYKNYQ